MEKTVITFNDLPEVVTQLRDEVMGLKSLLMQDLYKNSEEVLRAQSLQIDSLKRDLNKYHSYNHLTSELMPEMKVLFPYIK